MEDYWHWAMMETGTVCSASRTYPTCHNRMAYLSFPSRVCLCNKIGQPDCLTVADPTTRVIYPGQTITIPAVVVGQDFGTVTGSVFAQLFHTIDSVHMEQEQYNIAVEHSQCSNHKYTIFSQRKNLQQCLSSHMTTETFHTS